MNLRYLYIVLLIKVLACTSCENSVKVPAASPLSVPEKEIYCTFIIQPFSDVSVPIVDSLHINLKKIYPHITVNEAIPLPQNSYYSPRNRYRADSLIRFLWYKNEKNTVVIGVTNKDISVTKGDHKDWGVMGLAYCPGLSCIVSGFRLSKANFDEQLYKVAIHELGHTQGLSHCKDTTCYMRDANGKNRKDELSHFCSSCKSHLNQRGWIIE